MLDSSPVAFQPIPVPRPLKRSASVASLPTPPRTRHRSGKRRGRSRGSLASDSDSDSDGEITEGGGSSGDDANENRVKSREKVIVHKRRRTTNPLDDDDAFWLGESIGDASTLGKRGSQGTTRGRGRSGSSFRAKAVASDPEPETADHDIPLVYQRLQRQRKHQLGSGSDFADKHSGKTKAAAAATPVAPVSPPPSRRKTVATAKTSPSSPPATPTKPKKGKTRAQHLQDLPECDSPNNPFLDSPSDDGKSLTVKSPRTPPPHEEKPTITYVFRGVRGVYPNPLYNHAKKRPLSPPPESLLPPEHPDFSPDMRCPPRLLFPEAHHKNTKDSPSRSPQTSYWSQSSDEFSESPTTPVRARTKLSLPGANQQKKEEDLLRLPQMKEAVSGPANGRNAQRSPSPYQSDDEADDASEAEESHHHSVENQSRGRRIEPLKLDFGAEPEQDNKQARGSRSINDGVRRPNIVPLKF